MRFRIVTGEERERLLGPKVGKTFDAEPYRAILEDASNGEMLAVDIDPDFKRSEMLRFSRVARTLDKHLQWLPASDPAELVFEVKEEQSSRRYRPHKRADVMEEEQHI